MEMIIKEEDNKKEDKLLKRTKSIYNQLLETLLNNLKDIKEIAQNIRIAYDLVDGRCSTDISSTNKSVEVNGTVKSWYTLWNSASTEYAKGDLSRIAEDLTMAYYRTHGGEEYTYTPKLIKTIKEMD